MKNAVWSDTRAACCMLCVTMTTVYWLLSSLIRSSMARVEIGSSAEHGSSMRSTCGSTAMARAMQSRCCWPPDNPAPGLSRRSLTSFQRLAPLSERSTTSSRAFLFLRPLSLRPAATLSRIDIVGKGLGRWNTMPTVRRTATGSIDEA
ncbi:hypothetical protein JNB_16193 [Janibacter sp. HTCC2649]|nr:hypothetical protein JNB_16193 [Janibacter sp. HTCC2649]